MRDPRKYEEHGRNNPLSDEQRREHPYDFVSLPDQRARGSVVGHDRFVPNLLSGRLTLVYEILTPLHVGSGVFETAEQCGLHGGDQPVRGMTRRLGEPVLPGSGWKGAVRSRFEAITDSRLGALSRSYREDASKLPAELRPAERGKFKIEVKDPRLQDLRPAETKTPHHAFSPADALFGTLGYRGRVHPGEGVIRGPKPQKPLSVPPLESPAAHRLAKPGAAHRTYNGVEITEVEGRKFYYDGPLLESRRPPGGGEAAWELIDAVPPEAIITIDVQLESVTEAELGALLVSAGHGEGVGILRFGGYKPAGLGKVELKEVTAELRHGWSNRWQRPAPEAFDPNSAVAMAHAAGLIVRSALAELHEITTRTRP